MIELVLMRRTPYTSSIVSFLGDALSQISADKQTCPTSALDPALHMQL